MKLLNGYTRAGCIGKLRCCRCLVLKSYSDSAVRLDSVSVAISKIHIIRKKTSQAAALVCSCCWKLLRNCIIRYGWILVYAVSLQCCILRKSSVLQCLCCYFNRIIFICKRRLLRLFRFLLVSAAYIRFRCNFAICKYILRSISERFTRGDRICTRHTGYHQRQSHHKCQEFSDLIIP